MGEVEELARHIAKTSTLGGDMARSVVNCFLQVGGTLLELKQIYNAKGLDYVFIRYKELEFWNKHKEIKEF